ncbi:histone-like nucleoid-structuring protein Lsr2 [Streptomyces sp. NPDC021100]|uniref:Lsr2 family DNA-binding protein n=1 Tax=Streptomyces sp. NPDC021100 TaxID=3365114 RepID=UPI003791B670
MNDAYRAAIVTLLKQGRDPLDIQKAIPDVTPGEIAAVAEVEGLTKAHANRKDSAPAPDLDPQLASALAALSWGENTHTPRIRKLAARTRDGLNELMRLQKDAAEIARARAVVATHQEQLNLAEAKLRRLLTASPADEMDKAKRNAIRQWARSNGMTVAQAGTIPKDVMEAWERRDTAASPNSRGQNPGGNAAPASPARAQEARV